MNSKPYATINLIFFHSYENIKGNVEIQLLSRHIRSQVRVITNTVAIYIIFGGNILYVKWQLWKTILTLVIQGQYITSLE